MSDPLSWWTAPNQTETVCPEPDDFTANGIDLAEVDWHRAGRLKRATWTPQRGWSAEVQGADGSWSWYCIVWGSGHYGGQPCKTAADAIAGALSDWREIRRAD